MQNVLIADAVSFSILPEFENENFFIFFLLIARIRGEIQLYEIEVVDFTAEGGGKVVGRWRRRRLEKMVTEEIEEELVAEGDDGNWGKAECK